MYLRTQLGIEQQADWLQRAKIASGKVHKPFKSKWGQINMLVYEPFAPATPVAPTLPDTPVKPWLPVAPVDPGAPELPVEPVEPGLP